MKRAFFPLQLLSLFMPVLVVASTDPVPIRATDSASEGQAFVKNVGQIRGAARYYAQGRNSAVYFEPTSVVLDRAPESTLEKGLALRVEFPAAEKKPELEAGAPRVSRMNAFVGKDRARWRTDIPMVGEIRYRGVAPGADVVYRIANGRLKYDLVLAAGADLSQAVLRYRGAESLSIDDQGELVIHSLAGESREEAPRLYQEQLGRRIPVRGGYRIVSFDEVGFWAEGLDPSLPLVVDPGLLWSTFLGGNVTDYLHAVDTNLNGDVFVVGMTTSTNYPTTIGAYQPVKKAGSDVIVSRLRGDGSGLVWSTCLGGAGNDEANGVAVDASGNVYVGGFTYSTDFPRTTGAFRTTFAGGHTDGFVTKISAGGNSLVYSTFVGGTADETPWGIAVSGAGEAVLGGNTTSADFPTTAGVVKRYFSPSFLNASDGFVTRLNAAGTAATYSTFIGSDGGSDGVNAVAVDANGLAVLAGATLSPDFPTTTGAFDRTHDPDWDCFVVKLNSGATGYVFSTFLGGSGCDEAYGVAVDGSGNVFVTGRTSSSGFPTSRAAQGNYGGAYDAFITSLSPNGSTLNYSSFLGGSAYDEGKAVAVTGAGQACVAGTTQGSGFPMSGAFQGAGGGWDAFVTALSTSGTLQLSSYLGGSGSEAGHGVTLKSSGDAVLVGLTNSSNYPTTSAAFDRTHNSAGDYDGFVASVNIGLSEQLAVGDLSPADLELATPVPNPFSSSTAARLSLARDARVVAVVMDVQGRMVRKLADRSLAAGPHRLEWDGRDDEGHDVGAGLFLLNVSVDGIQRSRTMVRLP